MNHYHSNFNPGRVHNRIKEIRADIRNRKPDGTWRKAIKKLEKLYSIDFDTLMHIMSAYMPKNVSKEAKINYTIMSVLLLTATVGSAWAISQYLSKQNKRDSFKPQISNFKYSPKVYVGHEQNVNFTATDIIDSKNNTGPIASANVKLTHSSGDYINKTAERIGSNFFRLKENVTEGKWEIEAKVKDPAGNFDRVTSEFEVVKKPQPPVNETSFVKHFVDKGYNETILEALSDKYPRFEEEMFPIEDLRDDLEEIVKLTVNNGTLPIDKNPVGIITNIVYNNIEKYDIKNPEMFIANMSRVFNVLEKYSIIKQDGWFVGNLTKYQGKYILPIYGEDALNKGICVIYEDPGINKDFTPNQHHVYCLLMKYNPEIAEHKLGAKAGTLQIDSIVYGNDMDKPKGEEYVWLHFVKPRIEHKVQQENSGEINCLDYGDFEKERGFADSEYEMKTARLALMPIGITEIDYKTSSKYLMGPEKRLEIGIDNVNFDEELGKSIQEWLREISDQHYEEKGKVYQDAINGARESALKRIWPNSAESFQEEFAIIVQEDDKACYLLGLPYALRRNGIVNVIEQLQPGYAIILFSENGIYGCIRTAHYPTSPPDRIGHHTEANIIVERTSDDWFKPHLFGFYLKKESFKADYEDSQIKPYIKERDIDGNYNPMPLN